MRPSGANSQASKSGRRRPTRPMAERLEGRQLLAAIDLANIASAPFGVQQWGPSLNGAAGFRTTDVGDVNGDGIDDFVIGAPSGSVNGVQVGPANGAGGASLVFGSRQVNQSTLSDFLNLNAQQRIGDLALLGNLNQTNPSNGLPGFNYDGVQLSAALSPNGQLGSSVAGVGDVNGDGLADFLIGAPGGADANGLIQGYGRAYLVYGSPNLVNLPSKQLNLDTVPAGIRVLTFVTNNANARLGQAVTGVGNFLRDGTNGIALGAPNASLNGQSNNGVVYVVAGSVLRNPPVQPINVARIGQTGQGVAGVVFAGETSGSQAGYALASAGDVNADNGGSGGTPDDLLIGAPAAAVWSGLGASASGPGDAYLVYSAPGLQSVQISNGGVQNIALTRIGGTGSTAIPGADFTGGTNGDLVGYAVSTAGDFNGDGVSDILVGAPGRTNFAGRATLIYGRGGANQINGLFAIDNLASPLRWVYFDGPTTGALAGYSLTATGLINADTLNEIAIGAPGLNNSSGAAYLIPGNPSLTGGPFSLNTNSIQSGPVSALVITNSQATLIPNFVGASLGARVFPLTGGRYIDTDGIADFMVGSPGFSPTGANQRQLAGTAFALQGAYLSTLLPIPASNAIPVQIGVGTPTAPFSIDATTPDALEIYVGSNATVSPTFQPVTDIDPTSIVVNGQPFPGATVAADGDFNSDGITDAIVTISPRSQLALPPGTVVTFTVTGQTLGANSRQFSGQADVNITGIPVSPIAFPGAGGPTAPLAESFIPPFGEALVPAVITMSRLRYKPIPVTVATQQYRPEPGFTLRTARFYGLVKTSKKLGTRFKHAPDHGNTLGYKVFSRGRFPVGQVRFAPVRHDGPVVPSRTLI